MTQQPESIIFEKRSDDNYFNLTVNTWAVNINNNNECIPILIKGVVKLPDWIISMPFEFVTQENDKIYDVFVKEK